MIIKDIIKSTIPEAYKLFFKTKPRTASFLKGAPGLFSPAAFASKSASSNTKVFSTFAEPGIDIAKYRNATKVIPENVRSINNAVYKCVESLQGSNPKEYGFLIDEISGTVLQEGGGTSNAISLNFTISNTSINLKKAKLAVLHGHPPIKTTSGEMTLPVSLQDFIALNNTKIKKITAFDKHGLHSTLEKTDSFETLTEAGIEGLKQQYIKELMSQSSIEKTSQIRELMQYVEKHPESIGHKREIANKLEALQYQDGADIIIDEFWRKHASSYGLKYTSDFKL